MTSQELFEKIDTQYQEFVANHNKETKAAKARARKAIGEVKKLITEYRKASTAEAKAK
jgi:hypothetical protein